MGQRKGEERVSKRDDEKKRKEKGGGRKGECLTTCKDLPLPLLCSM